MAAKDEIDRIIPPQYTTEYKINGDKRRIRQSDEFVNVHVFETTGMLFKPVVEVNGHMQYDTYGLAKERRDSRQRIANGQSWEGNEHKRTRVERTHDSWLHLVEDKSG